MTDRESVRVKTLREIDTELRAKKLGYIDPAYLAVAEPLTEPAEPSGGPLVLTAADISRNTSAFQIRQDWENTTLPPRLATIMNRAESAESQVAVMRAENERLNDLMNTPELIDFSKAVHLEAVHQRERWGSEHDEGKSPEDWFWLLGYLAGKALHSAKTGDTEKLKHHVITTAAALNNWHAQILGTSNMRPGISSEKLAALTPSPESTESKPKKECL